MTFFTLLFIKETQLIVTSMTKAPQVTGFSFGGLGEVVSPLPLHGTLLVKVGTPPCHTIET